MDASLLTVLLGLAAALAPAILAPLAPNPAVCLALFAATFLCVAFASGASLAAVQDATPGPLRGQISALYYLVMNLFGLTLGPLLVPMTASVLPGKSGHLSLALSLTSGAVILIGLASIALVRPLFAAAVALRRHDDLR